MAYTTVVGNVENGFFVKDVDGNVIQILPPKDPIEVVLRNSLDFKNSVKVCTTGNVDLVSDVQGGTYTIDGVALQSGDRVLVRAQTNPSQNGIYVATIVASTTATYQRSTDADDAGTDITAGMIVYSTQGTVHGDKLWRLVSDDVIVLGTTALNFTELISGGSALLFNYIVGEEVGLGDGVTTVFNLANTPVLGTQMVFKSGVYMDPGGSDDYQISGTQITFTTAPIVGAKILATYFKV